MSHKALFRCLLPALVMMIGLSFFTPSRATAQVTSTEKVESMTIPEFKAYLAQSNRSLSMATQEELPMLKQGGSIGEYVWKFGQSVFILNFYWIGIGFIVFLVIAFFFTPVGMIFGGAQHAMLGGLLGRNSDFGMTLLKLRTYSKQKRDKSSKDKHAFAKWMIEDFIPNYKNNVTAVAFGGTAILIAMIGLRGIKFIVASQPHFIIFAILIEFSVLILLAVTTWYEPEKEKEEGEGAALPGKQLTLAQVQEKLKALEDDLAASVSKEVGLR